MRLRPISLLFSVLLFANGVVSRLQAQTTASGGLTGVVTDPSNAVVPDANVEIRDDATYIAQTAPGAIMNTDTLGVGYLGNVFILGMPGTSNLFTVNGINDNNILVNTNNSGVLGMMLGQNEVQEAAIVSYGYSGQFGGAAGSNINYLTKSGENVFHGNAAYYWNGSALNANDWIDNALGNPRPFDISNQWAGSLGGPIIRDKLFFFFDTEGMHLVLPFSNLVVLPSSPFESATMANIDSIFGPASASHKFYRQIFDLYNSTPGASKAIPGNFNAQDPTGCFGWTDPKNPNGLGTSEPCAVHFFDNLYHPFSESMASGRVDWNIGAEDPSTTPNSLSMKKHHSNILRPSCERLTCRSLDVRPIN